MSIRIRVHHSSLRPCEHAAVVKLVGHVGFGRCMDCGATVATPFTLH